MCVTCRLIASVSRFTKASMMPRKCSLSALVTGSASTNGGDRGAPAASPTAVDKTRETSSYTFPKRVSSSTKCLRTAPTNGSMEARSLCATSWCMAWSSSTSTAGQQSLRQSLMMRVRCPGIAEDPRDARFTTASAIGAGTPTMPARSATASLRFSMFPCATAIRAAVNFGCRPRRLVSIASTSDRSPRVSLTSVSMVTPSFLTTGFDLPAVVSADSYASPATASMLPATIALAALSALKSNAASDEFLSIRLSRASMEPITRFLMSLRAA